ncbi:family 43 glycosylhydrolase [Microbacterium yannicii]|uniref:family 43 glycosylhydrolase n=1 Tax=Microbacterium yannicii TaxID=671622 RepID=UPI000313EB3F|nr:family 43 glycosylhydrolase [Microbacterium yannicii]
MRAGLPESSGGGDPDLDAPAPREVYRDPVYDGATDPTVVRDPDGGLWMFYTQRRATHPSPGPGVAWVHGSRIAVARSADGHAWSYAGTLEPEASGLTLRPGMPPALVDRTHWAPEVIHDGTHWRMYLTEIDGVPARWEGHERRIVEYTSDDLRSWSRRGALALASDRVIDAAVARCPDGRWRLWYKDEAAGSVTGVASSHDLDSTWRLDGTAIDGRPHEGPFVFALGGWWWMLTDEWRGMAVYRSSDAVTWERRGGTDAVILGESGPPAAGIQVGRHGAVLVEDEVGRLFFFSHPWWDGSELEHTTDLAHRRSAVHVAALRVEHDELHCER